MRIERIQIIININIFSKNYDSIVCVIVRVKNA